MSELQVFCCEACGLCVFPERLGCPRCGGRRFDRVPAGRGRVTEETTLREGPRLATVALQAGPAVIARLDNDTGEGDRVLLEQHPDGAITAHPERRQ